MALRLQVLVLYLSSSALDTPVIGWANNFDADYWLTRVENEQG
jgi:hypothetical protein